MQVCDRCESPQWRVEELGQRMVGHRQMIELVNHHLCAECYALYLEWCAERTPPEDPDAHAHALDRLAAELAAESRLKAESQIAKFPEPEVHAS